MKYFCLFILCFYSINFYAQSNASLYENASVIKLKSITDSIYLGLDLFEVNHMSCRHNKSDIEFIVKTDAINWLNDQLIPFDILVDDLKAKIEYENAYMESIRQNKNDDAWFNIYRTYEEVQTKIEEIAQISTVASIIDIGESYENREIKGLKFSTGGFDKPAVFFNGCQHAREWVTVMASVYIANQLAQNYENDFFIQTLLNLVDVYIIPIANPDGYVYTHTVDRYWRKNRQINSGSNCVGTDLNRNWDADWNGLESTSNSACSDIYVGTSPFSATEVSVIKNYMESIPNLLGHLDIHSYSALVLGPWGYTNDQSPDHNEIVSLGNLMKDAISNTNGYPFIFGTGDANGSLYLASGTMPDWTYDSLGALGYTYELRPNSSGGGGFELPEVQILDACEENFNGALEMIIWAAGIVSGCTNIDACNYNFNASIDDGSCAEFDACGVCAGNGPLPGLDCSGNCSSGESLVIEMTDSYGDGWNGNILLINGTSLTIENGFEALDSLCYDPSLCVEVICDGGSWQEEVSWSINNSSGDELLSGGAPFSGEFNCNVLILGCTDPEAINFDSTATSDDNSCEYFFLNEVQTIDLPQGWFIFSTYIQPEFPSMDSVLSIVNDDLIIVKNGEGMAYLPDFGFNSIGDLLNDQGYLVKLIQSNSLSIYGTKIVPENYPISLNLGWNMFGYLRDNPINLEEALSPIQSQIIIVKNWVGSAYLPDWNYNGIGHLMPGEGYQVKLSSSVTFNYPLN
jgi:murein tripeptide amidase MpaA